MVFPNLAQTSYHEHSVKNILCKAMPDRLPPLTALRAFEAASRLMSFQAAASELAVTPAALSFQIRQLEDHLTVAEGDVVEVYLDSFEDKDPSTLNEESFAQALAKKTPIYYRLCGAKQKIRDELTRVRHLVYTERKIL